MPRVANSGPEVDAWYENHNGCLGGSSIADVCTGCGMALHLDGHDHGGKLQPYNTGEPVGSYGWVEECSDDHPDYDGNDYVCAICDLPLTDEDN